jgi:chaperonin GroES
MIKPLGDRVVVKVKKPENQTRGGIYIPTAEASNQATVVAVGSGKVLENGQTVPPEVKVGDKVLFQQYTGTKVTVEDEEYLILHEGEIIAVL